MSKPSDCPTFSCAMKKHQCDQTLRLSAKSADFEGLLRIFLFSKTPPTCGQERVQDERQKQYQAAPQAGPPVVVDGGAEKIISYHFPSKYVAASLGASANEDNRPKEKKQSEKKIT